MARTRKAAPKSVETLTHREDTRPNIPTAEYESLVDAAEKTPIRVAYERRNRDLDPQLVWRGKDEQDWSDLVIQAPPIYIQEKVHPKVLIDDLVRQSKKTPPDEHEQIDLFADFNRMAEGADKTDFYEHELGWTNRMILGDSLQVMASLAEREGLRGKVQCIYIDPPYGIKFNSNFQWSTTSRDVKDGNANHITREPEQVKAFRDTWRDGIHSYLTYLRDRLTVSRDLLADSGSIFVQISDENLHRVRALMDEVFGEDNFAALIYFLKTTGKGSRFLDPSGDYVIWYAKNAQASKVHPLFARRSDQTIEEQYNMASVEDWTYRRLSKDELRDPASLPETHKRFMPSSIYSDSGGQTTNFLYQHDGREFSPLRGYFWRTTRGGLDRLNKASRLCVVGKYIRYRMYGDDYPVVRMTNYWDDVRAGGFGEAKVYVVQTATEVIQRCVLMATDPGDLVLDPTCGSGTAATVSEQWGRRWITIDTSRVALALARARIMGARYPFYILADSREGQLMEAEVTRSVPSSQQVHANVRQGFVYERVPHITLKSIVNNAEVDVIWERWQETLEPLRDCLNAELAQEWREWEVPSVSSDTWSSRARECHARWWDARIARQTEIDTSIAEKAEFETLYDKPYEDKRKVRVAGPFTVESLSPHRMLGVDENDELIDPLNAGGADTAEQTFAQTILENLKISGLQQAHKDDRITFGALTPWPGNFVCGDGRYLEGETEKRAAIFIGPEFGTVLRADLVAAAREAGDAGFDVLIACAFNYEAHTTEFNKLGSIPVLKARINADLHMADDLKNTGKGNLFVIFGEPDIDLLDDEDGKVRVKLNGVDVFHPSTGEVQSDNADGIACWFIDTEYNEESFFVRHAYFLGADDPYKALKTTLKAEIDEEAWSTLRSDVSRPFDKPETGRIAVKVINHLGDEVMKVFRVD
jgi:adenine-specific DNA-methyltransferase